MKAQKRAEYESDELGKLIEICNANIKKTDSALQYLNDRGVDNYLIDKYKIGYFPQNLSILSKYVNFDLLKAKNIIRTNGTSDFSEYHSLIFPIYNEYNEVVGISGRTILDSSTIETLNIPKYKNSSYKKSKVLYGLNFSEQKIIDSGHVFVVEGYMDQISMFKNGIENSVAICGTAFSKDHYLKLRRYCDKIYFILDNDDAGYKSSVSIHNKFSKYGLDLKFLKCKLDSVKDIDEYFKYKSLSSFKKDFKIINLF